MRPSARPCSRRAPPAPITGSATSIAAARSRSRASITSIDFVNPHAYVYFEAANADGTKTAKRCEMRAATVLRRSGWSPEMFKAGEPIKITGAPDRFDTNSCYVHTVVFADGTTADRYAQLSKPAATAAPAAPRAARLPSGEPNITGDWAPEQVVMTDPRGRSGALVPVSRVEEFEPGEAPAPRGRRAAAGTPARDLHRGGQGGRGRVPQRHDRQPAHALRDDEHPVRLDVRRSRQSHHAERRHDHAAIRPARRSRARST